MKKATILAFRTTSIGGYQVRTNQGTMFLPKQVGTIETGMEIEYAEHKEGDPYPKSFGKEGKFLKDGIHDIMVTKGISKAIADYRAELASALG